MDEREFKARFAHTINRMNNGSHARANHPSSVGSASRQRPVALERARLDRSPRIRGDRSLN